MTNAFSKIDTDDIKKDLNVIKTGASDLGHHVAKHGKEGVDIIAEAAKDGVDTASGFAREELEFAKSYVQRKPVQSVAMAFAVGVVASMLLGRR